MKYDSWVINGFDRDSAVRLCKEGINPLISVFLTSRGIMNAGEARCQLGEVPDELHDPFIMADMDKAVARIRAAMDKGERIAIYGDYDVDGVTSCVLLAEWMRLHGIDVEIYIPRRGDEGYGLNRQAIDTLKERGISLIITVDCGITAIEEARYCKDIGVGLIITDHHECKSKLPETDAILDPKRPDCEYPHKALAGVGVAFKLICALEGAPPGDEEFKRYSDLVAIGTIADVMPIKGENRELVRRGLAAINSDPRPGISCLMRDANPRNGRITSTTVGFSIAPRLNAAGRMGQTMLSVELLMAGAGEEAETLAVMLNRLNTERRRLESEIFQDAVSRLPRQVPDAPIILAQRGWHQGVTGIVAARVAELCLLPVIIISIDKDGIGHGSCRSSGSFAMYAALEHCESILINFGGHEMAAGVTVAEENIEELRCRLTEYYRENKKETLKNGLNIDFVVEKPELLTIANLKAIERLEPFGFGNPPPSLCIKNAMIFDVCPIGDGKHTRFSIEKAGKKFECVYFSMPYTCLGVRNGMLIDIAFEPQINEYRGRISIQLLVLDVREAELA